MSAQACTLHVLTRQAGKTDFRRFRRLAAGHERNNRPAWLGVGSVPACPYESSKPLRNRIAKRCNAGAYRLVLRGVHSIDDVDQTV